ncbi:MAG: endonuclease V [Myxococcales bacterium]|nr:endonuclease V [Myxococcales bacterium]
MLACVDVDYREDESTAVAACVLFHRWQDELPADEKTAIIPSVEDYVPGQFFKRELPCILRVLEGVGVPLDAVIIDGYVWLGNRDQPGLGGHLYEALQKQVPIVGVAKTRFAGATLAVEVLRGTSAKQLHVTAAGMDVQVAATRLKSMHGPFRIPTMLKRADQLCRRQPSTTSTRPL